MTPAEKKGIANFIKVQISEIKSSIEKKMEIYDKRLDAAFLRIYHIESQVKELVGLVGSGDYKARSKLNSVSEIIKNQTVVTERNLDKILLQHGVTSAVEAVNKARKKEGKDV